MNERRERTLQRCTHDCHSQSLSACGSTNIHNYITDDFLDIWVLVPTSIEFPICMSTAQNTLVKLWEFEHPFMGLACGTPTKFKLQKSVKALLW